MGLYPREKNNTKNTTYKGVIMKTIFIINGMAGAGKDTFVSFLNEIIPTQHISIVDKAKETAKTMGWTGEKTEKDRRFLSDIKLATDRYDDRNYEYIKEQVKDFLENKNNKNKVLCIDMREKEQIQRAIKDFGARSVLVYRDDTPHILSNIADANVFNMRYDITINNNGTLEDLKKEAQKFIDNFVSSKEFKTKEEAYKQGLEDGAKKRDKRAFFDRLEDLFWFFN